MNPRRELSRAVLPFPKHPSLAMIGALLLTGSALPWQSACAANWITLPKIADPLLQNLTIPADATNRGMWSPVQSWPLNGLHAALLPTGKLLTFGSTLDGAGQNGRYFDVWDPSLGFTAASHTTSYDAARQDSFCATATFLTDGRLMMTGGNGTNNNGVTSNLYTPASGAVTQGASVADQRWYATMLTLPDGRPLILGGMVPYSEGMQSNPDQSVAQGLASMTPEVYENGTWRSLFGANSRDAFGPDFLRASYPRAWVMPNGQVFGVSAERLWSLDPAGNGGITIHGAFKSAPGNISNPPNVGATNTAVMFDVGKVLLVGGNGSFNGDGLPASNQATLIDMNGGTPVLSEQPAMSYARRYSNAVVLPDGKVAVTGGTSLGNSNGANTVWAAEIWNPTSKAWSLGANAAIYRGYHSFSLLLPNGTVLSTGGGAPGPVTNLNAEVYYPPYLFQNLNGVTQLAARPVIDAIGGLSFAHNGVMELDMASTDPVAQLVLIGNGNGTHSFNSGQRRIPLAFTQSGLRLTATVPNGNLAPPGYYQVFAVSAGGVPSTGVIVSVGATTMPNAPIELPRNSPVSIKAANLTDQAIGIDAAGLGILQALSSTTPSAADLAATGFTTRDGLSNPNCVSFEYTASPGKFLRHYAFRLQLGTDNGTALFKDDATFCPEVGLSGLGVSFRSRNYPANLIRYRDGQIWLDAGDGSAAFNDSASFLVQNRQLPPPILPSIDAPLIASGGTANYAPSIALAGAQFSWNFGDGSAATAFSSGSATSHQYAQPGIYVVSLTVKLADGSTVTKTFLQAVYPPKTATAPNASSAMILEPRTGAPARLWVVNPDNDSVSVFDTGNNAKLAEIAVGTAPRSIALAPDGRPWVVNKDAATISIISPSTLTVVDTVALPRASQPYGLVFAPNGSAGYLVLEAGGRVLKLDPTSGATLGSLDIGARARHLSVTADGGALLVSRFITPALPGEATATVDTSSAGGEVLAIDTATMALAKSVTLRHSDKTDTEIQGSGIPNYLGAAVISPDGGSAWVPSKQDNIKRGGLRNGQNLDFQNSVRAISSRIDLATLTEDYARRIDHDNSSLGSAAAYHPSGVYLFVALETSRQVAVVNALGGSELLRVDVGRAPQALTVSADGLSLYVQNFMDRSVSVLDLSALVQNGELQVPVKASLHTVATERLTAPVLTGKQLFYDARDPRLARDGYMSCASCHSEGGHDGRVWDFTGFGEGLRNTIALNGRAGLGQGFLHWSANFDEVQDFEKQIRGFAGGTGLMSDADFNTGTRSQALGDKKAGISADLDALAAFLGSLNTFDASPYRAADGSLTAAAAAGKTVFLANNCTSCHTGPGFTLSADATMLKNVGTLKASSGTRLGAPLTGLDIPTLRDVWSTGPYLHDGSAPSLAAAVQAHQGTTVAGTELDNLVAYLQQIGAEEIGLHLPPAETTACASENQTCVLPTGSAATVWFGANESWFSKSGVTGSIACNSATFGDPLPGTAKSCRYLVTGTNRPPTVSLTAPAANAGFTQGAAAITLAANAADGDGTVARVEFYDGATLLGSDTTAPYGLSWTSAAAGAHSLTAKAIDNAGASAVSAAVAINVSAATSSTPPANAITCAKEKQTCALPAGKIATVWYGAKSSWVFKTGVTGSIACNNASFSDPLPGTSKACKYLVTGSNLAPSAALASSYVSPWESLAAVNNDITPANSADKTGGAYGNWQDPSLYGRTDWVSFTWSTAKTLSAFEVYWWNDGAGIATPTAATLEYWNGNSWAQVAPVGLALNTFNRINFGAITTTSIRISMKSTRATGILEARTYGN